MPGTILRENESFDEAYRKFKKQCDRNLIVTESKARRFFETNVEIKKKEKAHKHRESVLDGIPKTMPPLERAFKVQNKIKKFDFEPKTKEESLLRVEKTFEELKNSLDFDKEKMKKEYGKLLFSLVNLGKIMDIEPYEELRKVNKEVEEEFRKHENMYIDKNKNEK
jgi:ribosomal protein S21